MRGISALREVSTAAVVCEPAICAARTARAAVVAGKCCANLGRVRDFLCNPAGCGAFDSSSCRRVHWHFCLAIWQKADSLAKPLLVGNPPTAVATPP